MSDLQDITVADIDPDPEQPRSVFDEASLLALGQNMKDIGQHVPVILIEVAVPGSPTRFVPLDGERRWRAAKACGIKKLKAIVLKARPTALELLKIRAGLDFHHRRLSWGERIDLAFRLQEATGCTVNELASMLQISQPLATKLCKVRTVAPEVRKGLDTEQIDIEKAYILSCEPDHAKQVELLKDAGASREQLRQKARAGGQPIDVKTAIARFPLPKGVTVTVQGPKMNLSSAVQVMLDALKELKRGQAEHWDITTTMRVMRDRCKSNS